MEGKYVLSNEQLKEFIIESFRNGIRLISDSILLYENARYPSSYQQAILAIEEFGKSFFIEDYLFHKIVDHNNKSWYEVEQKVFGLTYFHNNKQGAFCYPQWPNINKNFMKFINDKVLDKKKMDSIYVGYEKSKDYINLKSELNVPIKMTKQVDAKTIIDFILVYFENQINILVLQDTLYDLEELDILMYQELFPLIKKFIPESNLIKKDFN